MRCSLAALFFARNPSGASRKPVGLSSKEEDACPWRSIELPAGNQVDEAKNLDHDLIRAQSIKLADLRHGAARGLPGRNWMPGHVHLVGSVGLDTVGEVFETAGQLLGPYLKRVPDGEPGGRRLWISWQFPVLRANPYLAADIATHRPGGLGFHPIKLADGVRPDEVRFGELGYAREARASYLDFVAAREKGVLPNAVRFQVSLPTPFAVVGPFCVPEARQPILRAYEQAMLREVNMLCATIPRKD